MEELITDYESGALHPADLKLALVKSLNKILQVKLLSVHIKDLLTLKIPEILHIQVDKLVLN